MVISTAVNDFKGWGKVDYAWLLTATTSITAITLAMGGSTLSIISALANSVCVILVAQGKVSTYLWGTVGVVTYAYLAYVWGFYGESILNVAYYLPMQLVGYILWSRNSDGSDVVKAKLSSKHALVGIVTVPLAIAATSYGLHLLGGKMVVVDASTTILSVVAMGLLAARMKEQWILWIIVNTLSIYMWTTAYMSGSSDGLATLMMWSVFLLNSIYGAFKWYVGEELK